MKFRSFASPWNSPQQSAITESFAKANCVFIVITSAKYCRGYNFIAKYIFSLQFLILISRQNYCLQTGDIFCTC